MLDSPIPIVEILTQNFRNIKCQPKLVDISSFKEQKNSKHKECYNNVFKALTLNSNGIYVLGYVFIHNIPLEHAWFKEDGQYFDVTFPPEKHQYISVIELSLNDIFPFVEKRMFAPTLYDWNNYLANPR